MIDSMRTNPDVSHERAVQRAMDARMPALERYRRPITLGNTEFFYAKNQKACQIAANGRNVPLRIRERIAQPQFGIAAVAGNHEWHGIDGALLAGFLGCDKGKVSQPRSGLNGC
jgi:hypothetical protein